MHSHKQNMGPLHKDECHQCGMPVSTWVEHQEHVAKYHNNVWMYKCGFCDLLFEDQTSRLSHRRVHANQGKTMLLLLLLSFLIITFFVLSLAKRSYCDICGKSVRVMKTHMAFMHGTEFCPCPLCKSVFKHPDALKVHLRNHRKKDKMKEENDDLTCKDCGKVFPLKRTLQRHIGQVHLGDNAKKHLCCYCGKRFFGRTQKVS